MKPAFSQDGYALMRRLWSYVLSVLCMAQAAHATVTVTTNYGVVATEWTTTNGNMKMDFDWVRNRFVIQYNYGTIPPQYATIDLATKALNHLAFTTSSTYFETLLTVLPQSWNGYAQGNDVSIERRYGQHLRDRPFRWSNHLHLWTAERAQLVGDSYQLHHRPVGRVWSR
jgi:hypothetical protein